MMHDDANPSILDFISPLDLEHLIHGLSRNIADVVPLRAFMFSKWNLDMSNFFVEKNSTRPKKFRKIRRVLLSQ